MEKSNPIMISIAYFSVIMLGGYAASNNTNIQHSN